MARRRNPFASRRQSAPSMPKPITITAPVINIAGLTEAYEWFPVSKQVGFKLAFEWYSANVPALLFGDPLDEARQKQYDRATKSKNLGDSSNFPEEKLTSWTTAIHLYEKCWSARSLPKLDEHINKTDLSEGVKAVQTVLTSLNMAFTGLVTFRMTFNSEREFDGTEVLIPRDELKAMIPMSPLKIALQEASTVAKVVSIVSDDEGNQSLDGAKFMESLPKILTNVATWAESDRINIKAIGKAPKTARAPKTPGSPSTPKAPRAPSSNISVKDAMKITVINAGLAPKASGNRKFVLDAILASSTIAEAKAHGHKGMVSWGVNTLVNAGAISVQ